MTTVKILLAVLVLGLAVWGMIRGWRRPRPGPANNWRNVDNASRAADGTWAEGSTYTRSRSRDGTGPGF